MSQHMMGRRVFMMSSVATIAATVSEAQEQVAHVRVFISEMKIGEHRSDEVGPSEVRYKKKLGADDWILYPPDYNEPFKMSGKDWHDIEKKHGLLWEGDIQRGTTMVIRLTVVEEGGALQAELPFGTLRIVVKPDGEEFSVEEREGSSTKTQWFPSRSVVRFGRSGGPDEDVEIEVKIGSEGPGR